MIKIRLNFHHHQLCATIQKRHYFPVNQEAMKGTSRLNKVFLSCASYKILHIKMHAKWETPLQAITREVPFGNAYHTA